MPGYFSFNFFKSYFTKGNERTIRAKKNILVSFVCKGLSLFISFLIVPLTLGYVGKVEYGIWMTISAIIQWFAFFDIGLGNGLRNKVAEALALNDKNTARIYISSAFALIMAIAALMFLVFFIVGRFISWNAVLNTNAVSNNELYAIIIMVFFFFCMSFVLGLVSSILQAMQRYALNDIIGLFAQLLGLIALYILVRTTKGSLFYLCMIYGGKSSVVLLIAATILFLGSLKAYKPAIKYIQIKKALPLLRLGIRFFLNQILYLLLTQASVILVAQFFGPEDVTTFNLAVRYMSITSMGYIMVLTPFLSAFTEAYTKKENMWIQSTIKRINWVWLITALATIILLFFYRVFFKLWVGDTVIVPLSLMISLTIYSIIGTWSGTFGLFLNGIGIIQLQSYVLGIQALLFFPLSYLFYKLGFGLVSIITTQIIFNLSSALIFTTQYKKIITKSATGIWLK
jgi:O-antigen/teichoic acid export membrane protein